MVSLFLILFIILLLALIMEIAATALKLTGLDIHMARFQALSALTGTGFTTKETELIMKHRQRRGIIMALMVIGPICFLGMVTSLLISMKEEFVFNRLGIIFVFVILLLFATRSPRLVALFHKQIERQMKRYKYPRRVQLEEVLSMKGDHGVYELKITSQSHFVGKSLQETDLKEKGFIVLAIERAGSLLTIPKASDTILSEDVLVVFGQLKNIKTLANSDK